MPSRLKEQWLFLAFVPVYSGVSVMVSHHLPFYPILKGHLHIALNFNLFSYTLLFLVSGI